MLVPVTSNVASLSAAGAGVFSSVAAVSVGATSPAGGATGCGATTAAGFAACHFTPAPLFSVGLDFDCSVNVVVVESKSVGRCTWAVPVLPSALAVTGDVAGTVPLLTTRIVSPPTKLVPVRSSTASVPAAVEEPAPNATERSEGAVTVTD